MAKARNMIIDGYKKGTQLQMDQYGIFYIFNGRNPIDNTDFESYEILSEETSKDIVSTVSRGLVGSSIFGLAGTSASLTGKENKIYIVRVNWDKYIWKDGRDYSVFELNQTFYKMFMIKCTRTPQYQKELDMRRNSVPEKYKYSYKKWCEYNNVEIIVGKPRNKTFVHALFDNPDTNPILDCCRSINPEWEEYIKAQQQTQATDIVASNTTDIKSKLKELKSMFEEDLITEEEYNSKRQELLDGM